MNQGRGPHRPTQWADQCGPPGRGQAGAFYVLCARTDLRLDLLSVALVVN